MSRGFHAVFLTVGKVSQGPLVPKTETLILVTISTDLLSHDCLHSTCPLFLLPCSGSVWATALDGSLCVRMLLSLSLSLSLAHSRTYTHTWFSLCVWLIVFVFCVFLASVSPHKDSSSYGLWNHISPSTQSLPAPAWPVWFAWVHWPLCLFVWQPQSLCSCHTFPVCSHLHPPCQLCLVIDRQVTSNKSVCWQKYPKTYLFREVALLSRSDSKWILW